MAHPLIEAAIAAYDVRDYDNALRLINEILKSDKRSGVMWMFKGQCLYFLKRNSEAVECFNNSLALGGENVEDVFFWKILTLYQNRQFITAEKVILQYLNSPSFLRSDEMTAKANDMLRKTQLETKGLKGFFLRFKKLK